MVITALRPDRRSADHVVVEVDKIRFATLPTETVQALDLHRGLELDETRLEQLTHAADVESARRVALRMLASRPRAISDLLWRLRHRGLNPSAVAEVVGRLEDQGLLNDDDFSRHYVRVRSERGHGRARLLSDLLSQGVERRRAERAIDEVLDQEGVDPTDQARELARKRMRQLRHGGLSRTKLRRRVLGYLSRRGYRGWEVAEVVDELLGD
jgi:regulatory protein